MAAISNRVGDRRYVSKSISYHSHHYLHFKEEIKEGLVKKYNLLKEHYRFFPVLKDDQWEAVVQYRLSRKEETILKLKLNDQKPVRNYLKQLEFEDRLRQLV